MKVADLPEIAVRLGSASVRMTPALSIARSVAWTDGVAPKMCEGVVGDDGALWAVNGLALLNFTTAVP